jgi:hypothetical protein
MLLFRSEEHVDRWLERDGFQRGAILTPEQLWALARAWYRNRMAPDWRRRTPQEAQELFEKLGLTGPFWQLRP